MSHLYTPRTIREALDFGIRSLQEAGIEHPGLEAEVLLSSILRLDRIRLYTEKIYRLALLEWEMFEAFIAKRSHHMPVAYILNQKEFYGRTFYVDPSVLIPRPETEELVEIALKANLPHNGRILDVGTGSGCIGLTIALERPDLQVDATDVSVEALRVASRNQKNLLVNDRVKLYQGNLLEPVLSNRYDGILSNPPYIHPSERKDLSREVLEYEPELALFDPDPTQLYLEFIKNALPLLKDGGLILLETSPRWARAIQNHPGKENAKVDILHDSSQKERFVLVRQM